MGGSPRNKGKPMEVVTDIEWLRKPTEWVREEDNPREVAEQLFKAMDEIEMPDGMVAVGLAANQLGYGLRMFVLGIGPHVPICVVNPVVLREKGHNVHEETCLSLPGVVVRVRRPQEITVKGFNQYMKFVKYTFTGLHARVASHEIDHLDGKLIIDYEEVSNGETVRG